LEASSLGQLLDFLKINPSYEDLKHAAMDHCFAAAMRGECKNDAITDAEKFKSDVLNLRIAEIANTTGKTEHEVWECIQKFLGQLASKDPKSDLLLGKERVKDMRKLDLGILYSFWFLAFQVAVALSKYPAILCNHDFAGGPNKFTISNAQPDTIRAFEKWALSQGYKRVYAVPERGYGGAYEDGPAPRPRSRIAPG
jgi:hypothetical protein